MGLFSSFYLLIGHNWFQLDFQFSTLLRLFNFDVSVRAAISHGVGDCDGTLDSTERAAISHGVGVCDGTLDSTERAAISHGGGVCDLGHRGGSAGGLGSQNISFSLGKCIFLTAQVVTVQK